jgi:hypothetical protein
VVAVCAFPFDKPPAGLSDTFSAICKILCLKVINFQSQGAEEMEATIESVLPVELLGKILQYLAIPDLKRAVQAHLEETEEMAEFCGICAKLFEPEPMDVLFFL